MNLATDAERDMGGLPYWLLHKYPNIKLRTSDPHFLKHVKEWFTVLLRKMKPLLYSNGGPIIMVQSENEYGSYAQQTKGTDTKYLIFMRNLLKSLLGSKVLLYSTDGCSDKDIRRSRTPGVFSTVDFGPNVDPKRCFGFQQHFEPKGPLVNSEYYPGWLDHWGKPHSKTPTEKVTKVLDKMLSLGASVNIYMMHGGTSFGFKAGANDAPFEPNPTSYDYDAPISEAGDLTDKYFAIKNVVKKYLPIPNLKVNASEAKGDYGDVTLTLASKIGATGVPKLSKVKAPFPKTFEYLGQDSGLVLYETIIPNLVPDPSVLEIKGIHDRGYVFVNGQRQGILSRMNNIVKMPISVYPGDKLLVIVENQGRICYGKNINDFKGIVGNVTLNKKVVSDWTMTGYPFTEPDLLKSVMGDILFPLNETISLKGTQGSMSFWQGTFKLPCHESQPKDTFLYLGGKGIITYSFKSI